MFVAFRGTRLGQEEKFSRATITTLASGVDFLGWVHFPDHRVLRTTTKRRMFRRLGTNSGEQIVASYLGLLGHGNTFELMKSLKTKNSHFCELLGGLI